MLNDAGEVEQAAFGNNEILFREQSTTGDSFPNHRVQKCARSH